MIMKNQIVDSSVLPLEKLLEAKILIIDDQIPDLVILEKLLRQEGYNDIVSTFNPEIAAEQYKIFKPDLVILDLEMPDLDGFQVLNQFQEIENPLAPIIIMTNERDEEIRLRAVENGVREFLTKPLDKLDVSLRVQTLLEAHLMNNTFGERLEFLEKTIRSIKGSMTSTDQILEKLDPRENLFL